MPTVNRRDFFATVGAAGAGLSVATSSGARQPTPESGEGRDRWVALARRLADPVLTNLAGETLTARMPVEQVEGAGRETVTHLEALGRLLAGIAPWLELDADDTAEGRLRAFRAG